VLAVYDLGEEGGIPFLVTELLEGHTVRTVISGPRLPPAQVQTLALQLARGLAAAHARGIVHRDLKPENLFLTHDGRLKILDFGLARLTGEGLEAQSLTLTGAVFGTPGYLSPEQARGERAGAASDVFSAGAVIYELLTGARAFPGATLVEAGHAALHAQPAPLPASVPAGLSAAVMRSLEKDPARRFPSAVELASALERLEPGAELTLPPQPKSWRRSTVLMVAFATLALGAALASGARVLHTVRSQRIARGTLARTPVTPPAIGAHPVIPEPPAPPAVDGDAIARDVQKRVQALIPRSGVIGLLAGARALEKTNRPERAAALLRKSRVPVARLELFLLQRKEGAAKQAEQDLRDYARGLEPDEWPAPLVRAYLGEARDDDVLKAAGDEDERCEANYYLGRLHASDDVARARAELSQATAEGCDQADFAREELDALQSR